jgi:tetratricopeptide (TPR) repeat protein
VGDRRGETVTLHNLGQAYCERGRLEEAIDCEQRSLVLAREIGYRWGEGRALEFLGLALQLTGAPEAARVCWHEALTIFTELGASQANEVLERLGHAGGGP